MLADLRHALRGLAARPASSIAVLVTLALNAAWQLSIAARALDGYDGWQSWIHRALIGGTLAALIGLAACSLR